MGAYVLVGAVLLAVCQFAGVVWLGRTVQRALEKVRTDTRAEIAAAIRDWTEQPAPDQPSKLAQLTDVVGAVIGSAAARSIMASLNAGDSHTARVANGAADALQAQQNPILALLSGSKRGKGAAVMRLAQMLGPMFAGPSAGQLPLVPSNHNDSTSSVRDRLQKGGT